jgi:predicted nucleic acid-binding protein
VANLTRLLLADTSAWHRSGSSWVAARWRRELDKDRIATTGPVRLEVLYSTQSSDDYELTVRQLDVLRQLPCGNGAWERALDVQRRLSRKGALHHRSVKLPDLLVAAVAEVEGAVVWHYDEDFDRIAEVTGQPVEWIAPRGSL